VKEGDEMKGRKGERAGQLWVHARYTKTKYTFKSTPHIIATQMT